MYSSTHSAQEYIAKAVVDSANGLDRQPVNRMEPEGVVLTPTTPSANNTSLLSPKGETAHGNGNGSADRARVQGLWEPFGPSPFPFIFSAKIHSTHEWTQDSLSIDFPPDFIFGDLYTGGKEGLD